MSLCSDPENKTWSSGDLRSWAGLEPFALICLPAFLSGNCSPEPGKAGPATVPASLPSALLVANREAAVCPSLQEAWLLARERELKEEIRKGRDQEIELVIQRLEADMTLAKEESERAAESR